MSSEGGHRVPPPLDAHETHTGPGVGSGALRWRRAQIHEDTAGTLEAIAYFHNIGSGPLRISPAPKMKGVRVLIQINGRFEPKCIATKRSKNIPGQVSPCRHPTDREVASLGAVLGWERDSPCTRATPSSGFDGRHLSGHGTIRRAPLASLSWVRVFFCGGVSE